MTEQQFKELVHRHGPKVLASAYGVLGDASGAQDVHQEVFLAIWKRLDSYGPDVNWDGYLYRTTIRKALEHARRRRKEKSLEPEMEQHIPSNANPTSKVQAGELAGLLRRALQRLPEKQAQAFTLARLEGLEYGQIASIMDCSKGTARVHLHRALKQLAHEMRDVL